jgi:hypothetical protein
MAHLYKHRYSHSNLLLGIENGLFASDFPAKMLGGFVALPILISCPARLFLPYLMPPTLCSIILLSVSVLLLPVNPVYLFIQKVITGLFSPAGRLGDVIRTQILCNFKLSELCLYTIMLFINVLL